MGQFDKEWIYFIVKSMTEICNSGARRLLRATVRIRLLHVLYKTQSYITCYCIASQCRSILEFVVLEL